MIFVTFGTQKQDFSRALKILEKSKYLKDKEVIVQSGYTKYDVKKFKMFDFIPQEKMNEYVTDCEFVITHGGVGSIFAGLKAKKKVLAIPRLAKYSEHKDDHQLEICEELENLGYILFFKEQDDIDKKIEELLNMKQKIYENHNKYIEILKKEI